MSYLRNDMPCDLWRQFPALTVALRLTHEVVKWRRLLDHVIGEWMILREVDKPFPESSVSTDPSQIANVPGALHPCEHFGLFCLLEDFSDCCVCSAGSGPPFAFLRRPAMLSKLLGAYLSSLYLPQWSSDLNLSFNFYRMDLFQIECGQPSRKDKFEIQVLPGTCAVNVFESLERASL